MNTMKTMIARMPTTSRIAVYHLRVPFERDVTMLLTSCGIRETIPANRIMEIPLPMPNSLICSPIHIRKDAPAVKVRTITRP